MQRLGKHLAIWGSLLQLGIVAGFVMTFLQMGRAMSLLNPSEPSQLSEVATAIEISFRASSAGLILGSIGSIVTLAALFGCRYRAPWLHSVLCVLSLFWLTASPLVGLGIIGYLVFDRKSFYQPHDS